MARKRKLQLSRKQFDRLRMAYAVLLAEKYYGLKAEDLFVKGYNPEWLAQYDVIGRNNNLTNENKMLNDLFKKGKVGDTWQKGFMWYRKTKKGIIAYIPCVVACYPGTHKGKEAAYGA